MLKNLSIENVAVIEKASVDFSPGFNVLTGETGAGKSIIIDSINMILGARTSRDLIRHGSTEARVSAYFEDIGKSAAEKLAENGAPAESDGSCFVSRIITLDGKSRCKINGASVTASVLREVAVDLINIHGQHDNQVIFNPASHCGFIDSMADISGDMAEYSAEFTELKRIRRELIALKKEAEELEKSVELLRYQEEELKNAEITPGEKKALAERKNIIVNSEKIMKALEAARTSLTGSDEYSDSGAVSMLRSAGTEVESAAAFMPELSEMSANLEEALITVSEISEQINRIASGIDYNPAELAEIEERLDLLYRLSRKYGETEEEMLAHLEEVRAKLEKVNFSEENIEEKSAQYNELLEKCVKLAEKISAKRKQTALEFSKKIENELQFLNMPGVTFTVDFQKDRLSSKGFDVVEFLVATNAGDIPKPIAKIASGGELSRIMLAIKSVLAKADSVDTLIFDEIDTGVSGKAAIKISMKLSEVSKLNQVICVTHLAQIASFANTHLMIEKNIKEGYASTSVKTLKGEERTHELARMIYGGEVTDAQIKIAQEMLEFAEKSRNCVKSG